MADGVSSRRRAATASPQGPAPIIIMSYTSACVVIWAVVSLSTGGRARIE